MQRPFRLIVAGGRDFQDRAVLDAAIERAISDYAPAELLQQLSEASPYGPLQIISGGARGADLLGEQWAADRNVPVQRFPARWDDLEAEGAVVRTKNGRTYNANAGFARNLEMARNADAVLVMPGGSGTDHMVRVAQEQGLPVWDVRSGNPDAVVLLPGKPQAEPATIKVSSASTSEAPAAGGTGLNWRRMAGDALPYLAAGGGGLLLLKAAYDALQEDPRPQAAVTQRSQAV